MVTVGRVVRPHGNRGQVVVASETDFGAERFQPGAVVFRDQVTGPVPLTVNASREHAGRWVVGFDGVETIDAAETLRDAELRIASEAVKTLEPGAYYVFDLVGCEVFTTDEARVGVVARVDLASAVPMLVLADADDVLVPFVDAICRHVDVASKRIVIDPPEGLLDLNRKTRPR